jgi:uroporphyrinogen III methyltransferase/synthase
MQLEELGANVIEAPTIEIAPADPKKVSDALHEIGSGGCDWVIFTSANGVTAVKQALFAAKLDARALKVSGGIAAIGDATSKSLEEHLGLRADIVPARAVAEALVDALKEKNLIKGKRFVLLRADIGRPVIVDGLKAHGAARVEDVAVYETHAARSLPQDVVDALSNGSVHWITFTSSSTVKNFARLIGDDYRSKLANVKLASIGPITTQTIEELGLKPAVQAEASSVGSLVKAIAHA